VIQRQPPALRQRASRIGECAHGSEEHGRPQRQTEPSQERSPSVGEVEQCLEHLRPPDPPDDVDGERADVVIEIGIDGKVDDARDELLRAGVLNRSETDVDYARVQVTNRTEDRAFPFRRQSELQSNGLAPHARVWMRRPGSG
jgi:hypothetical protein